MYVCNNRVHLNARHVRACLPTRRLVQATTYFTVESVSLTMSRNLKLYTQVYG
jgi:hypothetical protein